MTALEKFGEYDLTPVEVARFWSKVEIGGPSECWLWRAGANSHGYGVFTARRRSLYAHRLSLLLAVPVPTGDCACHRCDVPLCVNPAHLFWGSNSDNIRDMERKGRRARGPTSGTIKVTPLMVREIQRAYVPRKTSRTRLARQYGVSRATIDRVLSGGMNHILAPAVLRETEPKP